MSTKVKIDRKGVHHIPGQSVSDNNPAIDMKDVADAVPDRPASAPVKTTKNKQPITTATAMSSVPGVGSVEVKVSDSLGRYFVAKKDLKAGAEIISEKPHAFMIRREHKETVCSSCLKIFERRMPQQKCDYQPCSSCKSVYYCSKSCLSEGKKEHARECALMAVLESQQFPPHVPMTEILLFVRILLNSPRKDDNAFGVDALVSNIQSFPPERTKQFQTVVDVIDLLMQQNNIEQPRSRKELLELFCALQCNGFQVKKLVNGTNDFRIGQGLYPKASLINHSCNPNATSFHSGSTLVVRALRDISAGEPVCISYTNTHELRQKRREHLRENYMFDCQCGRCSDAENAADRALGAHLCQKDDCAGVIWGLPDGKARSCDKCKSTIDSKCLKEVEDEFRSKISQTASLVLVKNDYPGAKGGLEALCKAMGTKLYRHHTLMMEAYTSLVRIVQVLGDHRSLVLYCKKAVEIMDIVQPQHSPTSTRFLLTTASSLSMIAEAKGAVLFHQEAIKVMEKAVENFSITRGPKAPETVEYSETLRKMKKATKFFKK